jgi:ubiquitin-activating enzyme E1
MIVSEKSEERLPMKFSKLVEHVSKKPIPPHTKQLLTEVMVMDEEGEDVEVNGQFYFTFGQY